MRDSLQERMKQMEEDNPSANPQDRVYTSRERLKDSIAETRKLLEFAAAYRTRAHQVAQR